MPTRQRIGVGTTGGAGGGGGPAPTGNLLWGPDFGEGAGGDGTTLKARAAVRLTDLALDGTLGAQAAVTMPALAVAHNALQARVAVAMPALALNGALAARATVTMPTLAADYNALQARSTVTMPALALNGALGAQSTLTGEAIGAPFWQEESHTAQTAAATSVTVAFGGPGFVATDFLLAFLCGSTTLTTSRGCGNGFMYGAPHQEFSLKDTEVLYRFALGGSSTLDFGNTNALTVGHPSAVPPVIPVINTPFGDIVSLQPAATDNRALGWYLGGEDLSFTAANPFTIAIELHVSDSQLQNESVILTRRHDTTVPYSLELFQIAAGQYGAIFIMDDNGTNKTVSSGTVVSSISSNVSHIIEIAYDGSTVRYWVDGFFQATTTIITGIQNDNDRAQTMLARDIADATTSQRPLSGWIHRAHISNVDRFSSSTANHSVGDFTFTPDGDTVNAWRFGANDFTTEVNTYRFQWFESKARGTCEVHRLNGVSKTVPINVSAVATLAASALDPDPDAPSVTTTVVNTLVFAHVYHDHLALTQTHGWPAGHLERTDFESNVSAVLVSSTSATRVFAATGATGSLAANCTETVATDAIMRRVAVAPGPVNLTP